MPPVAMATNEVSEPSEQPQEVEAGQAVPSTRPGSLSTRTRAVPPHTDGPGEQLKNAETGQAARPGQLSTRNVTWTPNLTHVFSDSLQKFITPPPTPPLIAEVLGNEDIFPSPPLLGREEQEGSESTPLIGETPKEPEEGACSYIKQLFTPSVIMGFISALCACLYTTGTKIATDQRLSTGSHISVPFLLFLRGIIGLPLCSYETFAVEGQDFPPGTPEQLPLMVTSGVLCMLGTASGLFAVSQWGNASVACIVNASPALTVILVAFICIPDLHEPLNLASCVMLAMAITGMIFVTRPEFIWGASSDASDVGFLPPAAALGQALMQSVTALMIRKIPGKPSAAAITFYVQISMLLFGLGFSCYDVYVLNQPISINWDMPGPPITGMLLFAVCGTGANYFKNKALRMSKSVLVVGMRFFTPILCYLADLSIMAANPAYKIHSDGYSYGGCALIITAGVLLLMIKKQREAASTQDTKSAELPQKQ